MELAGQGNKVLDHQAKEYVLTRSNPPLLKAAPCAMCLVSRPSQGICCDRHTGTAHAEDLVVRLMMPVIDWDRGHHPLRFQS